MSRQPNGGFIGKENITDNTTASGVYNLSEVGQKIALNEYPPARFTPSRSLRFRQSASAYLGRTFSSVGNRKTWTYSFWFKRGNQNENLYRFLYAGNGSTSETGIYLTGDRLQVEYYVAPTNYYVRSEQVFRDPTAWYHFVVVCDTTNAVANERMKLYVNGARITTLNANVQPTQNFDMRINESISHLIGAREGGQNYIDCYMSELNFIDGQALTPAAFGEYDSRTLEWKPKRYVGTYGTNGFYLPFRDPTQNTAIHTTATATAPSGGVAANALTTNAVYLTTNTSTGSGFDVIQYDFGSVTQVARWSIGGLSFTGGASTFQVQFSNDNVNWTSLGSLSVTVNLGNFSGTATVGARYFRLRATSYGTNGTATLDSFQLFQDGLALDSSGNNNPWSLNNISTTAGTTYDSMVDSPVVGTQVTNDIGGVTRGNYCTWNPLDIGGSGITLSNGNLSYTNSGGQLRGTIGTDTSSKWYWEFTNGTTAGPYTPVIFGISTLDGPITNNSTVLRLAAYIYTDGGSNWTASSYINGTNVSYITTQFRSAAIGDIFQVAYDAATGKVWFGKNNTWYDGVNSTTGSPSTGANPVFTLPVGSPMTPSIANVGATYSGTLNCGQRPFSYTPPTGFKSLTTTNLQDPTIKRPSEQFDVKLWNGNSSGQTIGNTAKQRDNYQINRSLRFRGSASAYLTRTFGTASLGNTFSFWVKRSTLAPSSGMTIFGYSNGSTESFGIDFINDKLDFYSYSSSYIARRQTAQVFTDSSAWYHIVCVVDSANEIALDRMRVYVNGVRITTFNATVNQNLNQNLNLTQGTWNWGIGRSGGTNNQYFDGYLSEFNFIDGQALTAESFGVFDVDGSWQAKRYTGTYGTNGFYLPMTASGESYSADVLVVAGGGSGSGGGGGAGGVISTTPNFAVGKTYTVTVGAGGTATGRGANSRLFGVTGELIAFGGGGGYQTGGSGGGTWEPNTVGAAGTAGQGNKGGNAGGAVGNYGCGGGGGGAGAAGTNGSGTTPGTGGIGLASSITGSSVYYGGGGGGGSPDSRYPATTAGGLGGGATSYYSSADAGVANTGGGGGTSYPPLGVYGAGGSGVVILRIPTANYTGVVTGAPTVTTSGSFTVLKFTSSGSYTA